MGPVYSCTNPTTIQIRKGKVAPFFYEFHEANNPQSNLQQTKNIYLQFQDTPAHKIITSTPQKPTITINNNQPDPVPPQNLEPVKNIESRVKPSTDIYEPAPQYNPSSIIVPYQSDEVYSKMKIGE